MKRGVIMLPHLNVTPSARLTQGTTPSPLVLRRAAVYWDAIEVPSNSLYDFALPGTREIMDLRAAGVLREEIVYTPQLDLGVPPGVPSIEPLPGEDMSAFFVRTQWALFQHREGKERGVWTIAQDGSELVVAVPESEPASTAEVELHNLLPVPGDNVPIAEILDFKQKRQAELDHLRDELDLLSRDVADKQRLPKTADAATKRVQTAISDAFRVMNERFETKLARRFGMSLSLGTVASVAATLAHLTLPPLWGAAAGMIGFKLRDSRAPKGLDRIGPYAFVYDVMKDLV